MPDRWTAATRGRPLAVVIKLRNCRDNESLCLRVKALGDTQRRRQPCWRCQKWSERVLLPSAARFRHSWMSRLTGGINFNSKKEKTMNPPEFICVHSSTKRTRLQKAESFIRIEGQRETKSENWTGLLQGNLSGVYPLQSVLNLRGKWSCYNTKLLHFTCSPEH